MKHIDRENQPAVFVVIAPLREIAARETSQRFVLGKRQPDVDDRLGEHRIGLELLRQLKRHAARVGVFKPANTQPATVEIVVLQELGIRLHAELPIGGRVDQKAPFVFDTRVLGDNHRFSYPSKPPFACQKA
jgi:hypothetical protein